MSAIGLVVLALLVAVPSQSSQPIDLQRALGTWRSAERFEGEARLSFAFKQTGDGIVGWGVLLGQRRKADDRATLALTFYGVRWSDNRFRFETMLPEDEGTIGWELVLTGTNKATLKALTEDGQPLPDDLSWDMTR